MSLWLPYLQTLPTGPQATQCSVYLNPSPCGHLPIHILNGGKSEPLQMASEHTQKNWASSVTLR